MNGSLEITLSKESYKDLEFVPALPSRFGLARLQLTTAILSLQLRWRLVDELEQALLHVRPNSSYQESASTRVRLADHSFIFSSGGRLEVKVQLPGRADVYGLWPAVWTM